MIIVYIAISLNIAIFFKQAILTLILVRYEKHRVWVVEANLKDNTRHTYKKRVFFIDEDSWQVAIADIYDKPR